MKKLFLGIMILGFSSSLVYSGDKEKLFSECMTKASFHILYSGSHAVSHFKCEFPKETKVNEKKKVDEKCNASIMKSNDSFFFVNNYDAKNENRPKDVPKLVATSKSCFMNILASK